MPFSQQNTSHSKPSTFIALLTIFSFMSIFKKYLSYMRDNPKGLWFKRQLYGWGWIPVSWQGWLVTFLYAALVVAFSFTVDENSPAREVAFTFGLPVVLLTLTLIRIAYKKGEKPRWQWGPDEDKDNH